MISSGVAAIDDEAFYLCEGLKYIDVETDNEKYTSVDGVLFNKDKTILVQYPIGNSDTSYSVPNGVTKIDYDAFNYCVALTSITLPDSVTEIGGYAFCNCYNLTDISIPSGVTVIDEMAFGGSGIINITIPSNITVIEDAAFFGCHNLTSVTIPDSVTTIGMNAFTFCKKMESVVIPRSVTSIDKTAFDYCEKMTLYCYKGSYAESYAIKNEHPYEYILIEGDLNIDYALDISDVLLMISGMLDGKTYKNADMNGDGLITLLDVYYLLETII